jgi:hypothetical protein
LNFLLTNIKRLIKYSVDEKKAYEDEMKSSEHLMAALEDNRKDKKGAQTQLVQAVQGTLQYKHDLDHIFFSSTPLILLLDTSS